MKRIRRGTAIVTLGLILFFLFLVVIGFILLTLQRTASEKEVKSTVLAFDDTQGSIMLLGLLRQPYPADVDGDRKPDAGTTLADAISLDDPSLDDALLAVIEERMPNSTCSEPDNPCSLTITWPDGRKLSIDRFDENEFATAPMTLRLPSARGQVLIELRTHTRANLDEIVGDIPATRVVSTS